MFPVQEACARFCGYNWDVPRVQATILNFKRQTRTETRTHTHNPKRVIFWDGEKIGTLISFQSMVWGCSGSHFATAVAVIIP